MDKFTLVKCYTPGLIGKIASLFGQAYVESHQFGQFFESRVARDLCDYFENYNPDHSLTLSFYKDDQLAASLTLDGSHALQEGAHLRWFIADPHFMGQGLGRKLLDQIIEFAQNKAFPSIYLWTLANLEPAATIYRSYGFTCEERFIGDQWGKSVEEEKLRLIL